MGEKRVRIEEGRVITTLTVAEATIRVMTSVTKLKKRSTQNGWRSGNSAEFWGKRIADCPVLQRQS